jgi:hypothetical protein
MSSLTLYRAHRLSLAIASRQAIPALSQWLASLASATGGLTATSEAAIAAQLQSACGSALASGCALQAALRSTYAQAQQARSAALIGQLPIVARGSGMVAAAVESLAGAQAALEALQSQPLLKAVADYAAADEVAVARREMAMATESLQATQTDPSVSHSAAQSARNAAQRAEDRLVQAIDRSLNAVATVQHAALAQTAQKALVALGYQVQAAGTVAQPPTDLSAPCRGSALYARAGDHALAVGVTAGGRLVVDTAGLDDGTCQEKVRAFVDELRHQGVEVTTLEAELHRRRKGGQLLETAARSGPVTAEGLLCAVEKDEAMRDRVRQADSRQPVGHTDTPTKAAATRQRDRQRRAAHWLKARH